LLAFTINLLKKLTGDKTVIFFASVAAVKLKVIGRVARHYSGVLQLAASDIAMLDP